MAEPGVEGENDAPEGDGNGEGQLVEALPSASIDGVVVGGLLHLHPSRASTSESESERDWTKEKGRRPRARNGDAKQRLLIGRRE